MGLALLACRPKPYQFISRPCYKRHQSKRWLRRILQSRWPRHEAPLNNTCYTTNLTHGADRYAKNDRAGHLPPPLRRITWQSFRGFSLLFSVNASFYAISSVSNLSNSTSSDCFMRLKRLPDAESVIMNINFLCIFLFRNVPKL